LDIDTFEPGGREQKEVAALEVLAQTQILIGLERPALVQRHLELDARNKSQSLEPVGAYAVYDVGEVEIVNAKGDRELEPDTPVVFLDRAHTVGDRQPDGAHRLFTDAVAAKADVVGVGVVGQVPVVRWGNLFLAADGWHCQHHQ
jgi:hypothetical protein